MSLDVGSVVFARCASAPERIALKHGDEELTYSQLASSVFSSTERLISAGVRRGDRVAVTTENPVEAIIGFLAAMNVGAAYLPLDTGLPAKRQQFLLAQSGARFCVGPPTSKRHDFPIPTIGLSRESSGPARNPIEDLESDGLSSEPAYIIFTSGSTGTPKGVAVSRSNLAYSTQARSDHYDKAVERFLLVSPLTFDSSVAGIYWTLCEGGTIVVPEHPVSDVGSTRDTIHREQVSHLLCIPSLWNLLLDDTKLHQLGSLQTVIVAGEACSPALARRHLRQLPSASLHNEYGPTEATVWCSVQEIRSEVVDDAVPIGKPIAGSTIHLLDDDQNPVGQEEEGEIYVSGPGVAIGYVGDSAKTEQRFMTDPFSDRGDRMYRTGDFGKLLPDGSLLYRGRRDGQVKIRGHRVEIEEVEGVLADHPDIKEAAVAAWEHTSGSSLVTFVVPRNGTCPGASELKRFAAGKLPSYMLPQRSVRCDDLPRTKHGKIDRAKLLDIAAQKATTRGGSAARSGPADEGSDGTVGKLIRLWERILGHSDIGMDDPFFDLGGDSLGAMQLVAEVERKWDVSIEISQLLSHSTIRSFAALIEGDTEQTGTPCLVPIQTKGHRQPLFCVHPGGGNVVCYLPLSKELGEDQPLYALRALGVEAGENPLNSVETMATEYIRQMRTVQPTGPYSIAGWSFGGIVCYEMAQQLLRDGEELSFVGVIDGSPIYSIAVLREIFPDSQIPITQMNEQLIDEYFEPFYRSAADAMLVPVGASREHTYRVLRLFASTMRAAIDYRAKPLDTTMSLIVAEQKIGKTKYGPLRDWSRSCESIDLHHVPGNHVDMMQQPHVVALADKLRHLLSDSRSVPIASRESVTQA